MYINQKINENLPFHKIAIIKHINYGKDWNHENLSIQNHSNLYTKKKIHKEIKVLKIYAQAQSLFLIKKR